MNFKITIKGGGTDPNYKKVNAILAGSQLIKELTQHFILSEVSEGKEPCISIEEFMANKSLSTLVITVYGDTYNQNMEKLLKKYCLFHEAVYTKN